MTKAVFPRLLIALLCVAASLTLLSSLPAWAQDEGWSQPLLIFESQGRVSNPTLVADRYGQVHAFWTFAPDVVTGITARQIYYTRLDRPDWTPVDIFLSDSLMTSLRAVGNNQQLILLWDGRNYSSSFISPSLSAREWSQPQEIGVNYSQAGLTEAADNSFWMGYGDSSINAVFARRFNPETSTWESPLFISNTSNINAAPDAVRLSVSGDGTLHAVWTEYQLPNGWPPLGVYYSQSSDGGENWTAAREMVAGGYNQPNVVSGAGHNVYMTWVGMAGVSGRYFSQSNDSGRTWSGTTALFPPSGSGSEGAPSMVVDSSNTLNVLFSDSNCVWFTRLEASGWTDPDCITRAIPSSHTEYPIMTLGLGNRLHVLWWTNDRQLWYMSRQLPVSGQVPLPTPTLIVPTAIPPTVPPTIVPTPTHLPDYGVPMNPDLPAQAGVWAIAAGIVPVLLLVLIVFIRRLFHR